MGVGLQLSLDGVSAASAVEATQTEGGMGRRMMEVGHRSLLSPLVLPLQRLTSIVAPWPGFDQRGPAHRQPGEMAYSAGRATRRSSVWGHRRHTSTPALQA